MTTKNFVSSILSFAICLVFQVTAHADVINYGDFTGDNVDFLMVTETSAEIGAVYGAPTVSGDSLNFLFPPGFISQSTDGGVDFVDGGLSFEVQSQDPGYMFSSISVDEFGAFFDFGDASISEVVAIAFVQVDGQLYGGQFDFSNTGGGNGPNGSNGGPWIGGLTINFPSTDQATFFFDNQLFTSAAVGGAAFIDKKNILITVGDGVPAIPEPASGMVILCGMALMTLRRRK